MSVIETTRRGGGVELVLEDRIFLVRPRGYIGRSLLKQGLVEANAYGHAHPDGWWHVTDTSRVRFVNPMNPVTLRRIQSLPNVSGYVVIAPARFVRFGMRLMHWPLRQDVVVRTEAEARSWVTARLGTASSDEG